MNFVKLVEDVLQEMPVSDIRHIRSKKFTTDIPPRSKFQIGDLVQVGYSDYPDAKRLRDKYGENTPAYIVGMQRNTGPGHSRYVAGNRYYIEFEDGKIYPLASQYVQPFDSSKNPGRRF